MEWNHPSVTKETIMANIKEALSTTVSTTLNTINESVPLVGVTVTTSLVAVNSWLVEMVNEDADFDKVNTLKAKMLNQTVAQPEPSVK